MVTNNPNLANLGEVVTHTNSSGESVVSLKNYQFSYAMCQHMQKGCIMVLHSFKRNLAFDFFG